jgi:N-acetylneuraminic acid mutarotase
MSARAWTHPVLRGLAAAAACALALSLLPGLATVAAAASTASAHAAAPPALGVAGAAGTGTGATADMTAKALCPAPAKDRVTCSVIQRTDIAGHRGVTAGTLASPLPSGYGPADLRSAYDLPASGSDATVAVVQAWDDPTAEADLAVYRQQYGLPPCTSDTGCFREVNENGGASLPPAAAAGDAGWTAQTSVDLDMVSAVCPHCQLLLVEAGNTDLADLGTGVNTAVALGAKFVVASWGELDGGGDPQLDNEYFHHPGVAITASTDDAGGTGYGTTPLYPAASQYVTAVGGTTLTRDGSTPRGWSETVWNNQYGFTLSGCSVSEPKPSFQTDKGCKTRTVADVAAVADPFTGVAAYDTYLNNGWGVYGGTGAAASIVAGIYALAGTPRSSDNPVSYPYASHAALNNITTGFDGPYPDACRPTYLCDAGPGYNGPTGWGSPHGLAAFAPPGPHGDITGQVLSSRTHQPAAGVTVQAGPASVVTDSRGRYDLWVPAGSYTVSVSGFGYSATTVTGVHVTGGGQARRTIVAGALPEQTISGEVTDAGHGWPMYARIAVSGDPAPVYTDPFTGRYSVSVPGNASYTLDVTSVYPGFQAADDQVTVGTADVRSSPVLSPANVAPCQAPGYNARYQGLPLQTFDASTAPAGWSVQDASYMTAPGWVFNNPAKVANQTGGTGNFAVTSMAGAPNGDEADSSLVTPVIDLSKVTAPVVSFANYIPPEVNIDDAYQFVAQVELSTDGGSTWTELTNNTGTPRMVNGPMTIPVPQAAGKPAVQVRFEFELNDVLPQVPPLWEIDNVYVGTESCSAVAGGGILAGQVTDANTGAGVDGATVTGSGIAAPATSTAIPGDPRYQHGFYWAYVPAAGPQRLSVTAPGYATQTAEVTAGSGITRANLALKAGRLAVYPWSVRGTTTLGHTTSRTVTVVNTGSAPATVTLVRRGGGVSPLGQEQQAAVAVAPTVVKGDFSTRPLVRTAARAAPQRAATAGSGQWTPLTEYPTAVADNAMTEGPDGKLYSIGGEDGVALLSVSYVYNPATQAWQPVPGPRAAVAAAAAATVGDEIITAGGYDANGLPTAAVQIFDPARDIWSTGASLPQPRYAAAVAALDGRLYVIGGCTTSSCSPEASDVFVYDPVSDSWTTVASYPAGLAFASCGAIGAEIVCAGGERGGVVTNAAYSYNPKTNTWTALAPLPMGLAASSSAAADGQLLVAGGFTGSTDVVTNAAFAYHPDTNTWTALPTDISPTFRGGGACGFDQVGGLTVIDGTEYIVPNGQQLPGYDQCNGAAPWLSADTTQVTLQPGQRVQVRLTMNAGAATVTQPGTYSATLDAQGDTPYGDVPVGVTMTVLPPPTWGEITGTVRGAACGAAAKPLPEASVQLSWAAGGYALRTGSDGRYTLWLDSADDPVTVIAGDQGWLPQAATAHIAAGRGTTLNFTLKPAASCT